MERKRRMGRWILTAAVALCFIGCGNNEESQVEVIPPFDPSQPVVVSDFTPKEGGVGQRLIFYGQNFGNDPEIVHVFIGGKEAKVIGVKGEYIYCVVPEKAFAGNIEIRIGNDENAVVVSVAEAFAYQRKMV
ncbi:MAG: IPT/TIG domain-containing protein, partial [Bacteroidales bacterium]|nr:IPT/TIG domain-containing protein [Bacteroidales bacterium]